MITSYGIVTIHNDIEDYEIDVANNRTDIPLVRGTITVRDMLQLMTVLIIVSTTVAILLDPNVLLWLAVYVFLGWLYSGPANFKSRGIWSVLTLGICYGVLPWALGYIVADRLVSLLEVLVIIASCIFSTGIAMLKDFKDVKGDARHNKLTVLVRHGESYVQRAVLLSSSLSYCVLVVAVFSMSHSVIITATIMCAACANLVLLTPSTLLTDGKRRGINGRGAKLLFFICTAITIVTA